MYSFLLLLFFACRCVADAAVDVAVVGGASDTLAATITETVVFVFRLC